MPLEVLDMALSRLGDYIELVDVRNSRGKYTAENVRGISTSKVFIETKANLEGVSLTNYKVVNVHEFAYVADTSRRGEKIGLAYADNEPCIISSIYTVFRVKKESLLLPRYLMMFFNRAEFDRYARFNSWGSARETFNWEDFCNIELEVPSIEIQKKYVAIYEGVLANLRSYEKGLDDLKLVCDGYIEDLRKKYKLEYIGPYMIRGNKNSLNKVTNVLGVGQSGFIKPQKKPNESLANYKIIEDRAVCYAPPLYNILSDAIHVYRGEEKAVCSPIYEVFYCSEKLNSEYLLLWLKRKEFKRYAEFYALGVRNTFDYDLMTEVKIPIPDINIQNRIVDVFKTMNKRKEFVANLKSKISVLCPILIRGSILEAMGGI